MTTEKQQQIINKLDELNNKKYLVNEILTDLINLDTDDELKLTTFIVGIDSIEDYLKKLSLEDQALTFFDSCSATDIKNNDYYYFSGLYYYPAIDYLEEITQEVKDKIEDLNYKK